MKGKDNYYIILILFLESSRICKVERTFYRVCVNKMYETSGLNKAK